MTDVRDVAATGPVHTAVTVAQWALERIHDRRRRLDFCKHMAGVFSRWAQSEQEALERAEQAERSRPARTPSGLSRAVAVALADGGFVDTKEPAP
jgi:hypothetical protein